MCESSANKNSTAAQTLNAPSSLHALRSFESYNHVGFGLLGTPGMETIATDREERSRSLEGISATKTDG